MFMKRRKCFGLNNSCIKRDIVRMKYVDAGGKDSCIGEKCRDKCKKCDVYIKCCD